MVVSPAGGMGWRGADGVRQASGALWDYYLGRARGYCLQASQQKLLQDEQPTCFFFDSVRVRQCRSHVKGMEAEGRLITSVAGMLEQAEAYYEDLFQAWPMA